MLLNLSSNQFQSIASTEPYQLFKFRFDNISMWRGESSRNRDFAEKKDCLKSDVTGKFLKLHLMVFTAGFSSSHSSPSDGP